MPPISFDADFDVEYGISDEVARGLRRVVAKNPSRFTFHGTGTYILGASDIAEITRANPGPLAVIDPGPDLTDHLDALLRAIGEAEVSHILVTHTHRDHSPLAKKLADRTGALTYGFGPHGDVPAEDPDDQIDFGVEDEPDGTEGDDNAQSDHQDGGYDADFTPDVAVRHGDVIAGNGWTIDCVHTPGHTSNHMCFGWREQGALFSGDHVMGWSTSVITPPDGDMATYMASLDLLLERDDNVYWPTHGNPIRNPHDHVRGFIEHRLAREAAIISHVGAGLTTIEQLVREMYQHVSPKLYGAAARSVHAHLSDLVGRGRITASTASVRLTDLYTLS